MRSRKRQNCGTSTLLFIESVAVQSTDLFPSARVRGRLLRIHGTRRHRTEKTCKRNRSQCNIYSLCTNRFFFFFFFLYLSVCVCVFPLLFVEKKNATGWTKRGRTASIGTVATLGSTSNGGHSNWMILSLFSLLFSSSSSFYSSAAATRKFHSFSRCPVITSAPAEGSYFNVDGCVSISERLTTRHRTSDGPLPDRPFFSLLFSPLPLSCRQYKTDGWTVQRPSTAGHCPAGANSCSAAAVYTVDAC
jgi:hypothetical protein